MNKPKEIISPSGKYKAIVSDKKDCFSLDVFYLTEDINSDDGESYGFYWSRKNNNPIFVEKGFYVEAFAIEELRNLMSEPDSPLSIDWIKDFSFCKESCFLDPNKINVYSDSSDVEKQKENKIPIAVKTIINFNGLYLVEEIGCEDDWLMGERNEEGEIFCWGYYGTLKQAIKGL